MHSKMPGRSHLGRYMVNVLVLAAPGINRDVATKTAFEAAGACPRIIHITQLLSGEVDINDFQVMCIPGGFSHGDHIQSGRMLALEFLQNQRVRQGIERYLKKGGLIVGVCNGFQMLVQCGLLPFGEFHSISENVVTLAWNAPRQFQSRWIHIKPQKSTCLFVKEELPVTFPIAHSEGRFMALHTKIIEKLFQNQQVVYQYCFPDGRPTQQYPINPNGATRAIAGICDPSGQIMGMMAHAEDFIRREHYPNWRRTDEKFAIDGLEFFKNIVRAV